MGGGAWDGQLLRYVQRVVSKVVLTRPVAVLAAVTVAAVPLSMSGCTRQSDPLAEVPEFAVEAPDVRVISPGENPRQLRYTTTACAPETADGREATLRVAGGIEQSVLAEGGEATAEAPAGGDVLETTVPVRISCPPINTPPDEHSIQLEAGAGSHSDLNLGQQIAANEGFLLRWWASETGAISRVKMLPAPESPEAGRQAVEQALLAAMSSTVVFPEQAVGLGGQWEVTNRIPGESSLVRTTTYTVTDMGGADGNQLQLDAEVEERPADRSLRIDNEVAGELDGQTLTVESTSTTSDGTLTLDLRDPLPTTGHVNATTRLLYAGGGSASRVVQDVTSAVTYNSSGFDDTDNADSADN